MTRYEAAVSTHVALGEPRGPAFSRADQLVIQFDGRAFVWHDLRQPESDGVDPVVTTMVDDATDSGSEMLATKRFISALSFVTDQPMAIGVTAAAGFKGELDRPLLGQPALAATVIVRAPTAIDVSADERLRLVLGLFREGRAANSPFYGFLALYNALDAAFDNNERQRKRVHRPRGRGVGTDREGMGRLPARRASQRGRARRPAARQGGARPRRLSGSVTAGTIVGGGGCARAQASRGTMARRRDGHLVIVRRRAR